jgi:hypothetical protein
MEGKKIPNDLFSISTVIWFGGFHTSSLKKIEYTYGEDKVKLKATTLNSKYVFIVEGE